MAMSVDEYVQQGAAAMSDSEVRSYCSRELKGLTKKLMTSLRPDREVLLLRLQFLVRIAAEYDDYVGMAGISLARREAVFALRYFLEDNDAIPDSDAEWGLRDDEIIAGSVLRRWSEELQPFADACGQRWDRLKL